MIKNKIKLLNVLLISIFVIPAILGMEPEDKGQKRRIEELSEWDDLIEKFYPENPAKKSKIFDEKFDALPVNMKEEIVKQYIVSLIQEYISSNKSNKLQIFFKRVGNLARANKLINSFVLKYMQGIDTVSGQLKSPRRDITCLERLQYDLFKGTAYKDWSGFWNLILDNLDVINIAKEELQEALLCFAVNKNDILTNKILNVLDKKFGVPVQVSNKILV